MASPEAAYLVNIDGIALLSMTSAFVRVFANLPEASPETTIENPAFLGYISILPMSTSGEPRRESMNLTFELDRTHFEQIADQGSLSITLVPLAGHQGSGSSSDFELLFDRIYIDRQPR